MNPIHIHSKDSPQTNSTPVNKAGKWASLLPALAITIASVGASHAATPKLLYANGTSWGNMTPTNVHANTAVLRNTVNKFPFDGLILHSKAGEAVFDTTKSFGLTEFDIINTSTNVGTGTFAGTLLQHNFGKMNSYLVTGQDPFTTSNSVASWTTTLSRATQFAALCQTKGLKGVVIDTEDYIADHKLFEWPRPGGTYDRNFVAANARLRGNQLMAAIKAGFPNAVVLSYVGMHRYMYADPIPSPYTNAPSNTRLSAGLQAAFFAGLVQARGSNLVVDGNEGYEVKPWMTNVDNYYYGYTKYLFPLSFWLSLRNPNSTADLDIIPTNMVASWPENVSMSVAANDLTDNLLGVEPTAVVQAELTKNLRRADDYAWYYSEGSGFDLTRAVGSGQPHAPSAALMAAIKAARDTANIGSTARIPGQVWFGVNFEAPYTVADRDEFIHSWTTGTWDTNVTTRLGVTTTALTCAAGTGIAVVGDALNDLPDENPNGKLTWTDYDVEAWVRSTTTAGDRGIIGRYQNSSNYFQFVLMSGGTQWGLYKKKAGVVSLMASGATTFTANTWYKLKVTFNRRDISCFISTNGVNYITLTNNVRNLDPGGVFLSGTSGTAAVKAYNSPTTFDEIVVRSK